ncbi:WAT1-related protein [Melia azedarach]|uniref:WAT1-related protein n=1 Tax=Melia azedarach TaxID=155640 RepID=A0ACC1YEA4_MELAZ|nr:WAT1-related protein [Melia azedarach]
MTWGQICNLIHGMKPALMMVVVQIAFAGVNIFYKLAANDGMSLRVVVAYRFIFATAFMVPVAFFFERESRRKLNLKILFLAFLSGLFLGPLCQNLLLEGMVLTSATFSSAIFNLIPAVTFVLAIGIGLEKLGIRTTAGKAKLLGTLIGIGGAMLLTFYKGAEIKIWSTHLDLLHHHDQPSGAPHVAPMHADSDSNKRLLGSLLALGSCCSFSVWLIVQAKMSKEYPYQYSSTALMCVMAAIQSIVFALCTEKDWSQWKLGWNIRLLTVAYSGIIGSGLMVTIISWCVRMRGPLFTSVFTPLMLVIVALLASLLLDEILHLGSVLGATLIVCGLYAVLWGKRKEMNKITQLVPANTSAEESDQSLEIVITSPTDHRVTTPKKNIKEEKDESGIREREVSTKENEENSESRD